MRCVVRRRKALEARLYTDDPVEAAVDSGAVQAPSAPYPVELAVAHAKRVVMLAAEDEVPMAAADDEIVSAVTPDLVAAPSADQHVLSRASGEVVRTPFPVQGVV